MLEYVAMVITFLIGLVLGHKYWTGGVKIYSEMVDVAVKVREALADNKIKKAELQEIIKEVNDVFDAVGELQDAINENENNSAV
jgi:hypothetical protein